MVTSRRLPSVLTGWLLATAVSAALPTEPIALLLPDPDTHTKLVLQEPALELLRSLPFPPAIISVVGAYRTGKSWLLNELMGVSCREGFFVGHQRHTQTKGVWILPREVNGTVRLYMDTEGFEGTGQAGVYDDRIFAFAALVSSTLVYNLAETVKQADIERLAFAAQLSQEFWRRAKVQLSGNATASSAAAGGEWAPPALLWLVQRDFLQGGSVEAYLSEHLHPKHAAAQPAAADEHAVELDKVRRALTAFEPRMRAMGLPTSFHDAHAERAQKAEAEEAEEAEYAARARGRGGSWR